MSASGDGGAQAPRRVDLWSLREDVHVEAGDGGVILRGRWGDTTVPAPGRAVLEALRRMGFGPVSLENIAYGEGERRELDRLLDGIQPMVIRSFAVDPEQPLISIVPLAQQARFAPAALPAGTPIRLSRFAVLRTDGEGYFLESPLSLHRVDLHHADAVRLIGALGRAVRPEEAAAALPYPDDLVLDLLGHLAGTGMVVTAEAGDRPRAAVFAEDTVPALAAWTPLDLMFHTRSTLGRHDNDFGATYPMGDRWDVEPAVKRAPDLPGIALPRPRWAELVAADPPLTVAVEAGEPATRFADAPLTGGEIGQLLYRAARVRTLVPPPEGDSSAAETSDRPYLNLGGCYEFEFYLAVGNCTGIPRGVYHYDPLGHRLERVNPDPEAVAELLEGGRLAANLADVPPVLIAVTARFRRLSRKYSGLSYALVLKNVGALLHTLHLVGTAMGLAACWAEIIDIDVSARVLGLDWRVESGVGGFMVGRPVDGAPPARPAGQEANDADWGDLARAGLAQGPARKPFMSG
ncbi:goadsporin biosynthesis protein [Planomonospora sphaerica]|uniref:Goadsporin biosynthesis protein n=1 Tax=Planomonospora sphaerica TaxID=161355 RepID=A0A161LHH2_9ACTN|nr:SagB family peptide dehydrogenase [Planomonospora sphaerica]GAT67154.1 goadsporin biosynthesis protein [Planomonospora sphaerica]